MTAGIHGGGVLTEGESESLDILDTQLASDTGILENGRVGPDGFQEITCLKRAIRGAGHGFVWVGDIKNVARAVEAIVLQAAKPAEAPGSKATGKGVLDALEQLQSSAAHLFSSAAGLVSHIAVDHPGIFFANNPCTLR